MQAEALFRLWNPTGTLDQATMFPSVLGAVTGDPRDKFTDASLALLAADHASVVSTDWWDVPSMLAEELPRG